MRNFAFFAKKWRKISFFAKIAAIFGHKIGKTQNFKNPQCEKFYILGNFNLANFGVNLTIFEEEDRFFVFFSFFGKNRNFFGNFPADDSKKKIFGIFFWNAKLCGIEPTYTKFQVIPTKNIHFIDIQSFHRDPKFKPPEAIFPYVLIQNSENTKMAAKSRKNHSFSLK